MAIRSLIASCDRYAGIDQVLAPRDTDSDRHDHATASDSLRDLLATLGRARRRR